jgi:hypothetical protein
MIEEKLNSYFHPKLEKVSEDEKRKRDKVIKDLTASGKFEEATNIIKDFMTENGLTTGHVHLSVYPYSAENMPNGDLSVECSFGNFVYYNNKF